MECHFPKLGYNESNFLKRRECQSNLPKCETQKNYGDGIISLPYGAVEGDLHRMEPVNHFR
jgi:hypothetical protein